MKEISAAQESGRSMHASPTHLVRGGIIGTFYQISQVGQYLKTSPPPPPWNKGVGGGGGGIVSFHPKMLARNQKFP